MFRRFLPGRHDEALAIAERGRTRAFADLLVERQRGSKQAASADPYIPVTVEHILETVNGQKALILYYSLAGGFLYSWLISPGTGVQLLLTQIWLFLAHILISMCAESKSINFCKILLFDWPG